MKTKFLAVKLMPSDRLGVRPGDLKVGKRVRVLLTHSWKETFLITKFFRRAHGGWNFQAKRGSMLVAGTVAEDDGWGSIEPYRKNCHISRLT